MKLLFVFAWFILFLCSGAPPLGAQQYFKRLEASDKFFNQRITHFSNGDLLIGDSSIEAVRTGSGGEIYMTRMDPCGNVLWSRAYRREVEYLAFKDFKINAAEEIFVYGSAYIGLDELIFFLKLDSRGNILGFKLFEPETVDHFTYNIDLKNGQLMAYGLILDFGTKKFGFVAMFDEALNFLWGKKFTPFASSGGARITNDNGFICRSGSYLFKLDRDGALEWATSLTPNSYNNPVSGPLEVEDGYILEAAGSGLAFFYKLDLNGQFLWKSPQFRAKSYPAEMYRLSNGNITATYSAAIDGTQALCRIWFSPKGEILEQQCLSTPLSIKPGQTHQSFAPDGTLAISGNADPGVPMPVDVPSFLLQSTDTEDDEVCFEWVAVRDRRPNEIEMEFSRIDTVILETRMSFINNTNVSPSKLESPLQNACSDEPDLMLIIQDTVLDCGQDWTVSLPSSDFYWTDNQTDNPRILSTPGTYQARSEDCGKQVVYEFTLSKPSCACPVYLPTAFSPNQDGRNDYLECYSDCEITSLEMQVFNRWGAQLFMGRMPTASWDGTYRGRPVPNGLYLVRVQYEWRDSEGNLQSGSIHQEVTVVK